MNIPVKTYSTARNEFALMDTGADKRLCYPAAGSDVGMSLWLFWNNCDAFYLIDPFYGDRIDMGIIMSDLAAGKATYMAGQKVLSKLDVDGTFDGVTGRRYLVWLESAPEIKKRLCFIKCGTEAWLSATKTTGTRYNIVLNKDYAGFEGNYPYLDLWGLLRTNGIFCETLGSTRTNEANDFAKYRAYGLTPLFKVVKDESLDQIGFADGFHAFQKTIRAEQPFYAVTGDSFAQIQKQVEAIFGFILFLTSYSEKDFKEYVEEEKDDHIRALLPVIAKFSNWKQIYDSQEFADWFVARLRTTSAAGHLGTILRAAHGSVTTPKLVKDLLSKFQIPAWGSVR
ncbi:MAG: hypothetical protein AAF439_11310 [Pseudomonadota bacterium]